MNYPINQEPSSLGRAAAAPCLRAISAHQFRKTYGGISNTTFYELVKRGDLSIHKIGRRTFVDYDEAERWWRSCAKGQR